MSESKSEVEKSPKVSDETDETDESDETEPGNETDRKLLNPFACPDYRSDVILLVEDQKLHVSKTVLSLASPVFEKMFQDDFKEKTSSQIPLPGKMLADMLEFLLCLYPSSSKPISRENLDIVLPLADEYQVQWLKDRCEAFVLNRFELRDSKYSQPDNIELVHFLLLADRYNLKKLLDDCINKTKDRNFSIYENRINEIADYEILSFRTKCQVLSKRMCKMEKSAHNVIEARNLSKIRSSVRSDCFPFQDEDLFD